MWAELFFRGLVIGLLASIPLGPIGVLCIQRTLSKSQKSGFVSGLGAATADTIFSVIAFFSLAVVLRFIEHHMQMVQVLGGLCVIVVGAKIFFSNPVVQIRRNRAGKTNLWQDYISVFFITLANPAFILIFITMFAAFGVNSESLSQINGSVMIIGVFAGASLWWFTLTFLVSLFRTKFRPRHLLWMNRIAGAAIIVLGAVAVLSVFFNINVDELLH